MADYVISSANLSYIENNLNVIHRNLESMQSDVGTVNDNVKVVYDEVGSLAKEFHEFVVIQMRQNRKQVAHTELVRIRQELEKKYGHYDIVRRTATGILQADDLGIVKQSTISDATEELMISTPNYWLAPCLVALAAWINDQPQLAEKALREGIKRNDEKTSLFFALICRRAGRQNASLKWTQRYLENQDEENLDRKTIIVLDAFASGLLGADSEGVITRQIDVWLSHLTEKPGFVEQQTKQWSDAINLKKKPFQATGYTYLSQYSKTWPLLNSIMEGATLHAEILSYFTAIFDQQGSTDTLKEQLDEILNSLVSDYDDEEIPLRKEEKFNKFLIQYDGDEARARQSMIVENTAFETHKDFTQLLTDAAMKPESSHSSVSTQKFAIALSKDWIINAYNDVVAQNRMKVPAYIEINMDSFNDKTTDGTNEAELLSKYDALINREKASELEKCKLTTFEQYSMYAGIAIAVIGLLMMIFGTIFLGLIAIIAGIAMVIHHNSKKKQIAANIQNIEAHFEEKRVKGKQILRATLAEVVDFRAQFKEKDSESEKVIDFLEQISPEQYVAKLSDSSRRIRISN
jgi:hypothetical protein